MARAERPRSVTPTRRRWIWAVAGGLLVAALVGGRWAAVETAERAWAATLPGGETYLDARALARWFRFAIFLVAVGWATGNLYLVSRAIGWVQMPRRLGDLEIVEAISRRVLVAGTLTAGLLFGVVLTWGTGDWWLAAVLAGDPARFGIADPILQRDLGFYVSSLPWIAQLQNHVLTAIASVTVVVGLLYFSIGMIGWRGGALSVSPRARLHLAGLLTCLALALAWGALLDPAESVGSLGSEGSGPALTARMRGATALAGVALVAALATLVWAWTGRVGVAAVAWVALLAGAPVAYVLLPAAIRGQRAVAPDTTARDHGALADVAFGVRRLAEPLPAFDTPEAALRATPLWDDERVATALRRASRFGPYATVGAVALRPAPTPSWLVAAMPDDARLRDARPVPEWLAVHRGPWSATGPPLLATESDTGLELETVALRDTVMLYGPGFAQYAVRDGMTGARGGIPLVGAWRRAALAWTLQSTELASGTLAGHVLLWRRDANARLARVAPFAGFEPARPVVADGELYWIAWGYVSARAFPLVDPVGWRGERVRYLRAGFIGTVAAAHGDTRLYLAPGADSLSVAWSRAFARLVAPPESLPPALFAQLPPPADAFAPALEAAIRPRGDTAWVRRPRAPVLTVAPAAGDRERRSLWRTQGFETSAPAQLAALFAATVTEAGPTYTLWRPTEAQRAPAHILGSRLTSPGTLRGWPAGDRVLGVQALFAEPIGTTAPATIDRVYVTWGEAVGEGRSLVGAWAELTAGARRPGAAGAPSAATWQRALRLLTRADSALLAGDMERFGRVYAELRRLFGLQRAPLAPPERPE